MTTEELSPLEFVFQRNDFYRRLYYLSFFSLICGFFCILSLLGIIFTLYRYPPGPLYFPADSLGRLIQDVPVSEPNMSEEDLLKWATEALFAVKTVDFMNYRSQLNEAQKYFTGFGWSKYMTALEYSNNLNAVTQESVIFYPRLSGPAKIVEQGSVHGARAWRIRIPIQLIYWSAPYNDRSRYINNYEEFLVVQRRPILQSFQGLGMVQLIENRLDKYETGLQEIS